MPRTLAMLVMVFVLGGCGASQPADPPPAATPPVAAAPNVAPAALQNDFRASPYNTVTGESPKYQTTQTLSAAPQQHSTSTRYAVTIAMD